MAIVVSRQKIVEKAISLGLALTISEVDEIIERLTRIMQFETDKLLSIDAEMKQFETAESDIEKLKSILRIQELSRR